MDRKAILLFLLLSGLPNTANALDLIWSNGGKDITVTTAVTCTLLVSPSGDESLLPGRWKLVFVGTADVDSALVFLNSSGPPDAAPTCSVSGPATDAERLSRQITVEFCGPGDGRSTALAAFVLRLDPSLQARIAAVPASDISQSSDSTFGASSEVTVNGGTTQPYPVTVWSATQVADSAGATQILLTGIGLDHVQAAVLQSVGTTQTSRAASSSSPTADTLLIITQTPTFMAARPQSPVTPDQVVVLSSGADTSAAVAAVGVTPQTPLTTDCTFPTMFPGGTIRPKDFAFIYALGKFHIFYIRHDDALPDASTEVSFGHAVSDSLTSWTQLSPVLAVQTGNWDNRHVWAPSIIEQNGTFYMFYTGVAYLPTYGTEYQRIGVATSTDLMTWQHYSAPVFGGNNVPWAFVDSTQYVGCQFRDPFVMSDPANNNQWLMYDVATPKVQLTQMIVGVGSNATGLSAWSDVKPFWNTDSVSRFLGHCESPHVFANSNLWYLFLTGNSGHPLQVEYASSPVADSSGWYGSWSLYRVLGNDATTDNWYASEFLRVAHHDYFAFVNYASRGIEIREISWGAPPAGGSMPSFSLTCPSVAAVSGAAQPERIRLRCLGRGTLGNGIALRIELPAAMSTRIDVFDVLGRRVKRVQNGNLPVGDTIISWNGRSEDGATVGSGIYFARLSTRTGASSARMLWIR